MDNKVLLTLLGAIIAAGLAVGYFATVSNAPCGSGECKPAVAAGTFNNTSAAGGQNVTAGGVANSTLPEAVNRPSLNEREGGNGTAPTVPEPKNGSAEAEDPAGDERPSNSSLAASGTIAKIGRVEDLQISASADNDTYYSHEPMNLTVNMSIDNVLPGFLKAEGIKNKFGAYKFKKSDRVNLAAGENTYSWIYTIPACYSCSGITPGEYSISVWFEDAYGGKSDAVTVTIEIKSEDEG